MDVFSGIRVMQRPGQDYAVARGDVRQIAPQDVVTGVAAVVPKLDTDIVSPGRAELIARVASLRRPSLDWDRFKQCQCGFLRRRVLALADLLPVVLVVDEEDHEPDEQKYDKYGNYAQNDVDRAAAIRCRPLCRFFRRQR
jgi:hypothetical protein